MFNFMDRGKEYFGNMIESEYTLGTPSFIDTPRPTNELSKEEGNHLRPLVFRDGSPVSSRIEDWLPSTEFSMYDEKIRPTMQKLVNTLKEIEWQKGISNYKKFLSF